MLKREPLSIFTTYTLPNDRQNLFTEYRRPLSAFSRRFLPHFQNIVLALALKHFWALILASEGQVLKAS